MASDLETIHYLCDQAGLGERLTFRKMFGEYALYVDGKVVAFVCDDQLFLKPNDAARKLLGTPTLAPAYPGSKDYFLLEEETEDRDRLRELLTATADALPPPKAKRPRAARTRPTKSRRRR